MTALTQQAQPAPSTPETRRNYFLEVERHFKFPVIVLAVGIVMLLLDINIISIAVVLAGAALLYFQLAKKLVRISDAQFERMLLAAQGLAHEKARHEGLIDDRLPGSQVLSGVTPARGRHGLHRDGRFSAYQFDFVLAYQHGIRTYSLQWDLIDDGWTPPASGDWRWESIAGLSCDGAVIAVETFGGGRQIISLGEDAELAHFDVAQVTTSISGSRAWRSALPTFYNQLRHLRAEASA
jgi:hypothetical protein